MLYNFRWRYHFQLVVGKVFCLGLLYASCYILSEDCTRIITFKVYTFPSLMFLLLLYVPWTDSTFRFLLEQWKDHFPPGYLLKEISIDKPFEEDACCCRFNFVTDKTGSCNSDLVLKYQWFVGERTPSNFIAIPEVTGEVMVSICVTCYSRVSSF